MGSVAQVMMSSGPAPMAAITSGGPESTSSMASAKKRPRKPTVSTIRMWS